MALSLSYQVELNAAGDSVLLYDVTGVYDASSNPGGYGAPNDNPEDILSASLAIKDYTGNTVATVSLLSAYTALGTSPTNKMLLVTLPWTYGDGVFDFVITISATTPLPSSDYTVSKIVLSETLMAVNQLWVRAFAQGKCSCSSKETIDAMKAEVIYRSIKANEDNINTANAVKILQLAADVQTIANNRCLI